MLDFFKEIPESQKNKQTFRNSIDALVYYKKRTQVVFLIKLKNYFN